MLFRYVVIQMLLWSIALIILFMIVRVPLMESGHHFMQTSLTMNESSEPVIVTGLADRRQSWMNALYHSIMCQTTLGAGDIQPISVAARIVTMIQGASTLLVFGLVLVMALLQTKDA
jgi:hypothetical protein